MNEQKINSLFEQIMKFALTVLMAFAFARLLIAECIVLSNEVSSCEVDVKGACVRSFTVQGREVLWQDPQRSQSPIWQHGGIPIAWPWFGRIGFGDESIHGFAWKTVFFVKSRKADELVLELSTKSAFLEYTIRLTRTLSLSMRTVNKSGSPLPVGMAFHPYFCVGERDRAVVEGYTTTPFPCINSMDKSVHFGKVEKWKEYVIRDAVLHRALRITVENSSGVNLWNPGPEKDCPGEISGDEWRRFIALEPFLMGANRFAVLQPNEEIVFTMSVGEDLE